MNKRIRFSLITAALILGLSFALTQLDNTALLSETGSTRIMQVVMGLILVGYGNYMPKDIANTGNSPRALRAIRFGGWAITLGGLAYAGLWAFAPYAVADLWSVIALGSAVVVMLGYAAWCRLGGADEGGLIGENS